MSETISVRFDVLHAYAERHRLDYNELCRTVRDAIAEGSVAALASPSKGIAGDAAYPMRDGYAGSTFISNASGHSLRIEYKTREQGDAAQAWLAGDAAPQEQPTDAERFCDTHCTWRDHHKDCHLAGGDKESVREQAVACRCEREGLEKQFCSASCSLPGCASPLPAVQTERQAVIDWLDEYIPPNDKPWDAVNEIRQWAQERRDAIKS